MDRPVKKPQDRRLANGLLVTIALLLLLLGFYIGAYYWDVAVIPVFLPAPPPFAGTRMVFQPSYECFEWVAERGWMPPPHRFFAPIHRLDRRLRPGRWNLEMPAGWP